MKDIILQKLIAREIRRQEETLDLIPSENFPSKDILKVVGSPLMNKYSEGYPGRRYYPGNEYYDRIEELARSRGLKAFGLSKNEWGINVQPYSGSPANLAIYAGLMDPGDCLMGMNLAAGGHLTHGHKVNFSGRAYRSIQYSVDPATGLLDYREIERLAHSYKPRVVISGLTAYPRTIDFRRFGAIARDIGAFHVADISHISGLVAAKLHPSPFERVHGEPAADVVMTTTHKMLRGPRGAVIIMRKELEERIDKAVFPGMQGGPHNNVTAAIAEMFFEMLTPAFKKYVRQLKKNALVLAEELSRLGFRLVTGGTDNHLMLVDMRSVDLDGMTAEKRLEASGIIANRNSIPGDPSPFKPSGVRMGTPALTSRGFKEKDMKKLARLIYERLVEGKDVTLEVKNLCRLHPLGYSF